MSFEQFQLSPVLRSAIAAQGYEMPTPIQVQAIPLVLQGRDVLGLAQTGTGKTAAFALPILQRLLTGPRGKVRALVLAPTRELAEQIHVAFGLLAKGTGLRSVAVYGGVSMRPQTDALRGKAEIVVACPGRLLDHLGQGSVNLSSVETAVLDEADQMLDMGFLPSIRQILRRLPKERQTLLFSATMPEAIAHLARECQRSAVLVRVQHDVPVETVSHALYPVREQLKSALLLELLRGAGSNSVLVFTRTKHRAKRLGQTLQKAGLTATSLQGNLSQNRRRAAMDGFRDGTHQILVATDIAARGIDVWQVTHVINFDVPVTPEAYTHRIGRTGRAARSGEAFTLVTDQDSPLVQAIERRMGRKLDRKRVEGFDYDKAVAQPAQPHAHAHPRPGFGRRHGGRRRR